MMTNTTWTALILLCFLTANIFSLDWDFTVGGGVSLPGEIVAADDLESENFSIELQKTTSMLLRAAVDLYPLPVNI